MTSTVFKALALALVVMAASVASASGNSNNSPVTDNSITVNDGNNTANGGSATANGGTHTQTVVTSPSANALSTAIANPTAVSGSVSGAIAAGGQGGAGGKASAGATGVGFVYTDADNSEGLAKQGAELRKAAERHAESAAAVTASPKCVTSGVSAQVGVGGFGLATPTESCRVMELLTLQSADASDDGKWSLPTYFATASYYAGYPARLILSLTGVFGG